MHTPPHTHTSYHSAFPTHKPNRLRRRRPPQPNGYIYASLVNACERGGQWERAEQLFREMQLAAADDIPLDSMVMVARKAL